MSDMTEKERADRLEAMVDRLLGTIVELKSELSASQAELAVANMRLQASEERVQDPAGKLAVWQDIHTPGQTAEPYTVTWTSSDGTRGEFIVGGRSQSEEARDE